VTVGGGDFDSRQNKETVNRLPVETHQTFFQHVGDRVTGVVIGHGDAVQPFCLGSTDQILRTGNAVAGKKRMSMEVEIKRHDVDPR